MENGCQCSVEDRNFFWLRSVAYGILVPQIGTESIPPALEAWSLNNWTYREVSRIFFFLMSPAFLMMHSAYKLNKQGDNIQP